MTAHTFHCFLVFAYFPLILNCYWLLLFYMSLLSAILTTRNWSPSFLFNCFFCSLIVSLLFIFSFSMPFFYSLSNSVVFHLACSLLFFNFVYLHVCSDCFLFARNPDTKSLSLGAFAWHAVFICFTKLFDCPDLLHNS